METESRNPLKKIWSKTQFSVKLDTKIIVHRIKSLLQNQLRVEYQVGSLFCQSQERHR